MLERLLNLLGKPLYYCSECGKAVKVIGTEQPIIKRSCGHSGMVIAPRRAILTGDGTLGSLPIGKRIAWQFRSWLSNVTGRCV